MFVNDDRDGVNETRVAEHIEDTIGSVIDIFTRAGKRFDNCRSVV